MNARNEIRYHFFHKILRWRPEGVSREQFLELIFGVTTRRVDRFEATTAFEVPGVYKPAPQVYLRGYTGNRHIKQGDEIYIRTDDRLPNRIDLEAPIGKGGREKIFQLTAADYQTIRPLLRGPVVRYKSQKKKSIYD